MFASSGADLFEVVRLPEPISSEVVIDDSPFIEPLTTSAGRDGYCVLLINRQVARILVGGSGGMREVASIVDDVHRWHDQGGWSQARYQRGIVKETRDHVKHAADELFKHFKRGTVQRLIIGTHDELRGEIEIAPPQLPARPHRRLDRHRHRAQPGRGRRARRGGDRARTRSSASASALDRLQERARAATRAAPPGSPTRWPRSTSGASRRC